jgi:hypothetical protein
MNSSVSSLSSSGASSNGVKAYLNKYIIQMISKIKNGGNF